MDLFIFITIIYLLAIGGREEGRKEERVRGGEGRERVSAVLSSDRRGLLFG